MSMSDACLVDDCKLRSKTSGYCMFERNRLDGLHPLSCEYGRFLRVLYENVWDFGKWKLREYKDGLIKATLRGKLGTVEVWGGHSCTGWVYFKAKGRGKEPVAITNHWYTRKPKPWHESIRKYQPTDYMHIRDAVAKACAMAGVQMEMVV